MDLLGLPYRAGQNVKSATSAEEDMSGHLKYFTEHMPATFVYAGIDVENAGLFTGQRTGKSPPAPC